MDQVRPGLAYAPVVGMNSWAEEVELVPEEDHSEVGADDWYIWSATVKDG